MWIGKSPRLEAIKEGDEKRHAVITHPHPLYGGNMHNNVVYAAHQAARDKGLSTLRFNFRGVGASEGEHEGGPGEIQDLSVALDEAGTEPIIIGYSFGSWIAANWLQQGDHPCILIAPPNGMFAFPDLRTKNVMAVTGSHDQFCDVQKLTDIIAPERLHIVQGVDHFWLAREHRLKEILHDFLSSIMTSDH